MAEHKLDADCVTQKESGRFALFRNLPADLRGTTFLDGEARGGPMLP